MSEARNKATAVKATEQMTTPADTTLLDEGQSMILTDSLSSTPQPTPIISERATRVGTTNNDNTEKL